MSLLAQPLLLACRRRGAYRRGAGQGARISARSVRPMRSRSPICSPRSSSNSEPKEQSGELARLEDAAKQRIVDSIEHPQPLPGIAAHARARARSISIRRSWCARTSPTPRATSSLPAGTRANPLDVVSLSKHLLFFDATDEQPGRARARADRALRGQGQAHSRGRLLPRADATLADCRSISTSRGR